MFRNKLFVIIAGVILLSASQLYAEDKIFTSSGQILPGEKWNNVYIYNDDTVVDMFGGLVDSIAAYETSTVNVTGGYVSTLDAREFSTANVSGGYVHGLHALDQASVYFSGNASTVALRADDFGTVNMTGGIADHISVYDSGTSNLYGGDIDYIFARNSSVVNIYGCNLAKTSSGGRYGYGRVYGFWSDGTEFTIDLSGSETYSHINLFEIINVQIDITPNVLNQQSKGSWLTCHIWLPEGYNVTDIEPDTILLERRFKAEWYWFNEKQNVVMAKFRRSQLDSFLEPGEIELIVSCYLIDGTYFEGTDTIKVIDKGGKK